MLHRTYEKQVAAAGGRRYGLSGRMFLAFIALTGMLLGTCFLAVFGRHLTGLLDEWRRESVRRFTTTVRSPGRRDLRGGR